MEPDPSPVPTIGPSTFPDVIGDFRGHDEPLDERVVAATNADVMLNRVYENQLGDEVIVNIGIWTKYNRGIPHSPEQCYPMAGWEIASRGQATMSSSTNRAFRIKQFIFQRDTSRIAVACWVHLGDQVITDSEEIRPMLQRLRQTGGNRPPLVKVMLHTTGADVDQAEARLSRFVVELFPYTDAIR
jgi:EpsI family protein